MQKILTILTVVLLSILPAKSEEISGNLPPILPSGVKLTQEVPVGGIIMWWGARSYVNDTDMPNWQICNGDPVKQGSPLLKIGITHVPNLEGKFSKGAESNIVACPTIPNGAGHSILKGLNTGAVQLGIKQIPGHTHDVSEAIESHTHDPAKHYVWRRHSMPPSPGSSAHLIQNNCPYQHTQYPLSFGKGGQEPPSLLGEFNVGKAHVGAIKETALACGLGRNESAGHAHLLPDLDLTPEYVNVFYLIRVK